MFQCTPSYQGPLYRTSEVIWLPAEDKRCHLLELNTQGDMSSSSVFSNDFLQSYIGIIKSVSLYLFYVFVLHLWREWWNEFVAHIYASTLKTKNSRKLFRKSRWGQISIFSLQSSLLASALIKVEPGLYLLTTGTRISAISLSSKTCRHLRWH